MSEPRERDSEPAPPVRSGLRRALLGLVLVPTASLLAFAGAMTVAGRVLAAEHGRTLDAGLAAAEWGLGAALVAACASVGLAATLPPRALARATLGAAVAAGLLAAWAAIQARSGA